MKYKTIIELICDAVDRDEATNVAGEYLRGEVDFGVSMKCRTLALGTCRVITYAVPTVVLALFLSALLCRGSSMSIDRDVSGLIDVGNTCTVVPALKTENSESFKDEWERKQNETVLNDLKK